MGHKVHPVGFRIGVIRDWQARWYADKHYAEFLHEDLKLREAIRSKYAEAGISLVEIERQANKVSVTIHTARPGVVIGRGGQRVDEMRHYLEDLIGKRIQLNIQEVRQPELDAYLVARTIAEQIEHRVAYRRAIKQAVFRTTQAGAKGVRVSCAGRLGGAEIARRLTIHQGQVPLHTLRADIDYGLTEAHTTLGRIGVKVWIYKGDILPEAKGLEVKEIPGELVAGISVEAKPSVAAEPEEKTAEPAVLVAEESTEAVSEAKPEEKPPKPRARKAAKAELPTIVEKEESAEAVSEAKPEEKPPKPRARKAAKAELPTIVEKEESAEAVSEVKPEEKPPKPKARKTAKAELPTTVEKEETDATTQTGKVPQDS